LSKKHTRSWPAACAVMLVVLTNVGFLTSCSNDNPDNPSFVITATADSHGNISPSGQVSVSQGADQTFAMSPDSGYQVADVQVDAASIGAVSSHTFSKVAANHSIHATFSVAQPTMLAVDSGLYYHGVMGNNTLTPRLVIRAEDSFGNRFASRWIRLADREGDGLLSADSLETDAEGAIFPTYTFNGDFGYAVIRAMIRSVDTVDLILRASTLSWGADAQGQYVKLGDTYAVVKGLNGEPASIDVDSAAWYTYANYQTTKGVVLRIVDANQNSQADDAESVDMVIVTIGYAGTFANGIGIGATMDTGRVDTALGVPDSSYLQASPARWKYVYKNRGLTLFANLDTPKHVVEIRLKDPGINQPPPRKANPTGLLRQFR
jgi:hypothetical protein